MTSRNEVIVFGNDVITKNNGNNKEMQTSAKPKKLYINRKVLMRAIQNCTFYEFEPLCKNLWTFLSNFGIFYDAQSPNMIISRNPRSRYRFFLFFLILHLILGKFTKFIVGKLSTSEITRQKPHGGGGV